MSRLVVREHIAPDLRETRGALMEMCLTQRRTILIRRRSDSEQMKTHQLVIGYLRSVFIKHKPPSITCNRSNANIGPDDHVSEKKPSGHQWLSTVPWRHPHYRVVWGIES